VESHQSSSVEVPVDMDSIQTARIRRQTAPTLPRTWEEYYYASNLYQDHPDFDEVSSREFYNTVKGWPWNSTTGNMAPPGQFEAELALRKDLQRQYSDEFTFDELPDPRLYGIDERDLLSRVKEYKLREDNRVGYRNPTDYWTWMQIFEQENVQLIRNKHMTSLQEDPFMVLDANPIVGNLICHGPHSRINPDHAQNRFQASQTFGDLYNRRARLLAEVMTQSEVRESVQWDDLSQPSPKPRWIRFQRWLMYFWHRYERLLVQPNYVPMYVDPEPIHELLPEYRRMATWIGLNPITGHYQMLPNITHDIVPSGKTMFNECIDATQWFTWKLWPSSGITVYPTQYALLRSDIPEIQNYLNLMRTDIPTWGRSLLNNHNGGWGTNN
jgi:hypothetical protein